MPTNEDGRNSKLTFSFGSGHYDKGIKYLGPYDDKIFKKEIVKKGEEIKFQIPIKVVAPGIWQIVVTFTYKGKELKGTYGMKTFVFVFVTENESIIYNSEQYFKEQIPWKEADKIASYIQIIPPLDKGVFNLKTLELLKPEFKKFFLKDMKKDKTKASYIAYLPKENRLDFEPTYQFKVKYFNCEDSPESKFDNKPITKEGSPLWSVTATIGSIDNTGLFTATSYGKGEVCVKHGSLEDCIDVEVIPHPNPSPADKIVDVVVVPYDTKEEKENYGKIVSELKGKKFKTKEEAKEFFKNRKILNIILPQNTVKTIQNLPAKALGIKVDGNVIAENIERWGIDRSLCNNIIEYIELINWKGEPVNIKGDKIVGLKLGECLIYAETKNGNDKIINLIVTPLEKIMFNKDSLSIPVNSTIKLELYGCDKDNNCDELFTQSNIGWDIKGTIGYINKENTFTATNMGKGVITASLYLYNNETQQIEKKEAKLIIEVTKTK